MMVFTEYINEDRFRIKSFTRRLLTEHTLANHSINTCIMGLWLYLKTQKDEYTRRKLDRITMGLLLHDIGMTKVPKFILDKPKPLTGEERGKVLQHVMDGAKHLHKLELVFDEVQQIVMDHHERHDGSGYPRKLASSQISSLGSLCAIADSFAAMISTRPHAPALTPVQAVEALYKDMRRYNERLLGALHAAYMTKELQ
ncbi:HD-GYP domain-containing protein [uncultured Cohaesibacter sp.]|uniref:HD-GYP domain-containing protein n=1 Tax=uncultured Cohaesibacter sp. TaxID=1002546 RepID=UPI0037478A22